MQILHGPGKLRLELDPSQIFTHDPGQGTPAMVYCGNACGTFWAALNTGELIGGDVARQLTSRQWTWLESMCEYVCEYVEHHTLGHAQ